ncbi:MAG: nucleotidyltransferase domain-containing protein [Candidatus Nanohaloarchaea archaeon]
MDREQVREDFQFLEEDDRVLAVLVFGSQVAGKAHERSDIDICIVAPDTDPMDVMGEVWAEVPTDSRNYDVHTFEEFSLKMKHQVMEDHEKVWCRDESRLEEYFYRFRKLWNDQAVARGVV